MSNQPNPRTLPYAVVDVFAERPLEGNPLAIFPDAHSLSSAEMQRIARETNLSETTFILPADPDKELAEGVRVRIFTTEEELPFAGHPTLGTASWLYLHHPTLRGAPQIRLMLDAGVIPVSFRTPATAQPGVFSTMRQLDPTFGRIHDPAAVAHALGLTPGDLDGNLPVQSVSTGVPFCIVPLRSLSVAHRLAIPQTLARQYLANDPAKFFFCITPSHPSSDAQWHARMQFYGAEDPATGSASGCAAAYLVHHGMVPSGQEIVIEQGIEISRPSRITASAIRRGDAITDVFVAGRTIPVASGHFFLP